jgi:hypothetical protein
VSQKGHRRGLGCLATVAIAAVIIAVVVALTGVTAWRYVPLVPDVQELRQAAQRLSSQVRDLEPADLDRDTLARMDSDLRILKERLDPIMMVMDDPLVEAIGAIPFVAVQLDAADSLLAAADALVEVGEIGVGLVDRVVTMREANEADASFELTTGLVELIATSGDEVDRMDSLIADAQQSLDAIPPEALEPIREARDLVAGPLDTYRPLLEQYRQLDEIVPGIMGWGGQKRYLVLAQNPAELRPAGGYAGTVGLITLEDGKLIEQEFRNVYDLDLQKDLPFIAPPEELTELLLASDDEGNPQSWRLADAAWSPDFPTGAQRSAEFYALESDGAEVDGVIAITTYALDRLLEIVGPVEVPAYGVTVEPGDVTLTLLGATRGAPGDLEGRKDVLDALARTLMQRLLALPPEQWGPMVSALEEIGAERMAMIWLEDQEAQRLVVEHGWGGPVRTDPGDYLYVVESNVAPTSKYNLVVDRSDSLVVKLDEDGGALSSLRLDWQNDASEEGEPYDSLRAFSENEIGWYGAYVRTLIPEQSELVTASGQALEPVRDVDRVTTESGRLAYGNYLLMPPGPSTMSYLWAVPDVAVRTDAGWEYRLLVQKQPGSREVPLSVRVDLPTGAEVLEMTEGMVMDGDRLRYEAELAQDVELRVLYELPAGG